MVRVLIIEDSVMQVTLILEMLRDAKDPRFEAMFESKLQDGLDHLSKSSFDAILLDLTLPDSAGVETCERMCAAAPNVPVIVLTAADDEQSAAAALEYGAADYLVKGEIGSDLLARSIRYSIARKKVEMELQRANDELEKRVEERTAELQQAQAEVVSRKEELAHAARLNMLGELASGLAHELNQPLMAIVGFTDHCLDMIETNKFNPERMTETLSDTSREARRAGEIIKRMRRLVSRRSVNMEPTDLNDAIEESVDLLRPGADVNVQLELCSDLPEVLVDRVQIQQVILNLGQNAVQAMENQSDEDKHLLVRSGRSEDDSVFVEVVDNGPGMAPEHLERLFEPFFTRNKPDGLGLGLSITHNIVETHGGQLAVSPNETSGLTLRFTLPVATIAQAT